MGKGRHKAQHSRVWWVSWFKTGKELERACMKHGFFLDWRKHRLWNVYPKRCIKDMDYASQTCIYSHKGNEMMSQKYILTHEYKIKTELSIIPHGSQINSCNFSLISCCNWCKMISNQNISIPLSPTLYNEKEKEDIDLNSSSFHPHGSNP